VTEIEIRWLGQAGFAAIGSAATIVFDPYLSDLCRDVHGLERQMPAPSTPAGLGADVVLVSHWHEDHLDLSSAAEFAESGAVFVAPSSCAARLLGMGIPSERVRSISSGQTVEIAGATVTAVPARHRVPGFITEDAVGFVVELDGIRVYHSGDTEYDRLLLGAASRGSIDVALLCTNGTGGNMNTWEAAVLAAQLEPALAVPMHFGMWRAEGYGPAATLDPEEFRAIYERLAPGAPSQTPSVARPLIVASRPR
jgi:L-ascorbate 6-phosphate lactonase